MVVAILYLTIGMDSRVAAQKSDKRMVSPERVLAGYGVALTPEGLLEALKNENGDIRENAAHVVGERGVKAAVPTLKNMLGDGYPRARVAAAGALLRLGDEGGTPVLLATLSDPDAVLAAAAARALSGARRDTGYAVLSERVKNGGGPPRDRVLLVRAIATYKSVPARESDVRDVLIDTLRRDAAAEVRRASADELTKFNGPAIGAAFTDAAKSDRDEIVRGVAQAYLAKSGK
jgi:hypothetical protein